ncbi:MAG: GNAT family N-acetyltransferase [Chloroflexi bacterium]|nr:GNAT family N-acetyltransferase [Chloroflexota bacterium]
MIYGERIRLRGVERDDIPRFVAWFNDPEVTEGLTMYLPMTTWEEEQWFENLSKRPAEERPLAIEARLENGWQHIGSCGFHNIEWTNRAAEVGIAIGDKSVWNQGYGTETMRLLLEHGFETLNLNRIFLRVHESNLNAVRSYEKVGFVHEGRMRQAVYKHGKYEDMFLMSVLRSEWNSPRVGKNNGTSPHP